MDPLRKGLSDLLRPAKQAKGHRHATHIVLFAQKGGEPQYMFCFEDQIDIAFHYLWDHDAEFVTVIELGHIALSWMEGAGVDGNR